METVREFLTKLNQAKGYDVDDDSLVETLIESGTQVNSYGRDEHRWYICEQVVNELEGLFIEFTDYIITGDNSMDDMDLSYDLDAARFVEEKTRQIIETYYE